MNILIIEDELRTAKDLIRTLEQVDENIKVVKHTLSVKDSIEYLNSAPKLDLIFSDIKLGDGLSFEIFDAVDINAPVIFCTAYDEFALEAFKTNGIDYVLKPFSNSSVERALEKFHRLTSDFSNPNLKPLLDLMMNRSVPKIKSLLVHRGDKIIPVKVADIALFYVEDKYSFAHTEDGKRFLISHTLEDLGKMFPDEFYRVNRQYIVKRSFIKEAVHQQNRKLKVVLSIPFDDTILVGKLKITNFLEWLEV